MPFSDQDLEDLEGWHQSIHTLMRHEEREADRRPSPVGTEFGDCSDYILAQVCALDNAKVKLAQLAARVQKDDLSPRQELEAAERVWESLSAEWGKNVWDYRC